MVRTAAAVAAHALWLTWFERGARRAQFLLGVWFSLVVWFLLVSQRGQQFRSKLVYNIPGLSTTQVLSFLCLLQDWCFAQISPKNDHN